MKPQCLDLFRNLGLFSISKWVGLKFTTNFPSGSRPYCLGLSSPIFWPNHRLRLIKRLSMLRLTSQAPFFKPSLINTYAACESIKLRVETNPTLRLITQVATKATPQWFGFGPWQSEPPHLRVHLEGHVTLPHFKDVNIFVDVSTRWTPLVFSPTFVSTLFLGLITSWSKKPIRVVCLCSQCRRF